MTQPPLPLRAFAAGGRKWTENVIPKGNDCSSRPIAAVPTDRARLWKTELQKLANKTGLSITVAHDPPGTSKWNRIEHRMFSFISINWRGKPLVSHQVIIQLIAATKTETGLKIRCAIDEQYYPKALSVPKAAPNDLNITFNDFHPDWNYTIRPHKLH